MEPGHTIVWVLVTLLTASTAKVADDPVAEAAWIKELEHDTQGIYDAEGYSRPVLWTDTRGQPRDPARTAKLVNEAKAWTCNGNPPRCARLREDTEEVVYHGEDTTVDHRGMGTRYLGGPSLTLDNIWMSARNYLVTKNRPPTVWETVQEGASPVLASGVHPGGKPYRLRWAFDGKPLYDHTNGLPDNGERHHHTEFWISHGFDLNLVNVTSRDTGTYTAVYKLRENDPILETEIMMTVQYLPIPRVFGKEGKVNLVYMRRKETRTTATCLSALGEPPADMTWYKDGTKADEATVISGSDDRRLMKTIKLQRKDVGALLTCKVTSTHTATTATASTKVKGDKQQTPLVQESKNNVTNATLQPVAVAILTITAIAGLAVGITGAVVMKKKRTTKENPRGKRTAPGKKQDLRQTQSV